MLEKSQKELQELLRELWNEYLSQSRKEYLEEPRWELWKASREILQGTYRGIPQEILAEILGERSENTPSGISRGNTEGTTGRTHASTSGGTLDETHGKLSG